MWVYSVLVATSQLRTTHTYVWSNNKYVMFLNQAHTWFLKIDPVQIVGMHVCLCVCPLPRLLITSGVMWHDIDLIWLVKQVLQLLYGDCSHYR